MLSQQFSDNLAVHSDPVLLSEMADSNLFACIATVPTKSLILNILVFVI